MVCVPLARLRVRHDVVGTVVVVVVVVFVGGGDGFDPLIINSQLSASSQSNRLTSDSMLSLKDLRRDALIAGTGELSQLLVRAANFFCCCCCCCW